MICQNRRRKNLQKTVFVPLIKQSLHQPTGVHYVASSLSSKPYWREGASVGCLRSHSRHCCWCQVLHCCPALKTFKNNDKNNECKFDAGTDNGVTGHGSRGAEVDTNDRQNQNQNQIKIDGNAQMREDRRGHSGPVQNCWRKTRTRRTTTSCCCCCGTASASPPSSSSSSSRSSWVGRSQRTFPGWHL